MKTMTRAGLAALLLGGILGAWAQGGRAQQEPRPADPNQKGVGEKVGEALDRAGRTIKKGARDLGEDVQRGFQHTRASVHSMGVASRVYGRLHWDKALQDARIELDADKEGVVTLRGTVPDAAAREKAVTLARDTVGVARVMDLTTIGPPTTETKTTETVEKSDGRTTVKKKVTVEKDRRP